MDPVGVIFVGVFCVVGAVIAYYADILGRNIGKTRRTLGGLRPRHTAALIVAVAGFLIPLLTALILFTLSSDVRTWITEGRRAVEQRNRLVSDLRQTKRQFDAQIGTLRGEVRTLEKRSLEASAAFESAKEQLTSAQTNLKRAQAEARQAESEVGRLKLAETALRQRSESLRDNVKKLQSEYDELLKASETLRATNSTYSRQNTELGRQNIEFDLKLRDAQRNLTKAQRELTETESRLTAVQGELQLAREQYDKATAQFQQEKDLAARQVELSKMELDAANAELERVRQLSDTIRASLDTNLRVTRTSPMIFTYGEEIVRLQLDPNLDKGRARDAVTSLVRSARVIASERGARPSRGSDDVTGLIELPLDNGRKLTVPEQIENITSAIDDVEEQSVIIAYALWNTFQGEFLPLRIEAYRNPIVYMGGEIVAETRVNGNLSEELILSEVRRFVEEQIRDQARRDRMIPAAGRLYQFGEVSGDVIVQIVRDIKATGRLVRLVAYAQEQTRAADPLRLEFRVR